MKRYRAEWLPNGLVRVYDYHTGTASLYTAEGLPYALALAPLPARRVLSLLAESIRTA